LRTDVAIASGMAITVASLHRYVIKSCRGESLDDAVLDARGIADDRRFMVVDASGGFLSQRQLPRLALIVPHLSDTLVTLTAPDVAPLTIDLSLLRTRLPVSVWEHRGEGEDCGDAAAAWLTSALARPARLVRMPDDARRAVDPRYADSASDQTGYSDGYPLLLVNRASLDALNARLPVPVPLDRFRPNLVIAGAEPFAEDAWRRIRIGDVEFAVVKPCARCVTITVDQVTGERGPEPLRTLATFRSSGGKVLFGQNLVHRALGRLRVGDPLTIGAV